MKRFQLFIDGKCIFDAPLDQMEKVQEHAGTMFAANIDIAGCKRLTFGIAERPIVGMYGPASITECTGASSPAATAG